MSLVDAVTVLKAMVQLWKKFDLHTATIHNKTQSSAFRCCFLVRLYWKVFLFYSVLFFNLSAMIRDNSRRRMKKMHQWSLFCRRSRSYVWFNLMVLWFFSVKLWSTCFFNLFEILYLFSTKGSKCLHACVTSYKHDYPL